jgi:Mlc titration factor MtfA (ptsG expression regulator)
MQIVLLLLVLAGGFYFAWRFWTRRAERRALLASPLSAQDRAILSEMVPLLRKLPQDLHAQLEGKINLFLEQVEFIGCEGLDVTDEMRLSIAAQACLLVVNTDVWYTHLKTLLIYPGAFKSHTQNREGYVVREEQPVRLGESWSYGPVVLSWEHSEEGAAQADDGRNVVFHEFAHQLDNLSGYTDGAPVLSKGQSFREWERVILEAYDAHVARVERGHKTVLDAYGAQAHEEFFAVAVELFFERPEALRHEEPDLYDQLCKLFRLSPADW